MVTWRRKTPLLPDAKGVVGTLRLARRDDDVDTLDKGEIVLVAHPDLDDRQAQALIDHGVVAVLNGARSSSGRAPNTGPHMLAQAGILLIDITSEDVWTRLKDGDTLRIEDGQVFRDDLLVASGIELDEQRTADDLQAAREGLATRLDSIAANATDHIHREHAMLMSGAQVPRLRTGLRGRPVVVVSRAYDDVADLKGLRRWIREHDPILIGAGAGADVLIEAGLTPGIVVGALDNISDAAIKQAGEVVVTTPSGMVEGVERLERHGMEIVTFVASGSDDDLAILLADTNDAGVIVHVGAPSSLPKLLERPPTEAARMFVARLRAGARIVDAKAVHHFSSRRHSLWPVFLLLVAGIVAVAVAIGITPVGQDWYDSIGEQLTDLGSWIKGLFT
jgi:uncharacterized membrane-anchored protein